MAMADQDTLREIKSALRRLIGEGGAGNFVIFEPPGPGNRYVQFSCAKMLPPLERALKHEGLLHA